MCVAPPGLIIVSADDPRLAPWATILRHSVARVQRVARQRRVLPAFQPTLTGRMPVLHRRQDACATSHAFGAQTEIKAWQTQYNFIAPRWQVRGGAKLGNSTWIRLGCEPGCGIRSVCLGENTTCRSKAPWNPRRHPPGRGALQFNELQKDARPARTSWPD